MKKYILVITVLYLLWLLVGHQQLSAQAGEWEKQLKGDPTNTELLLKLGKFYHDLGGSGKKDGVAKAEKYLAKLLEFDPENGTALVYYGSVCTMKARDAGQSWEAMEHLQKGFSRMDKAVLFEPQNLEVRLIRAINSTHIPDTFGRFDLALEDFKVIDAIIQETPPDSCEELCPPFNLYYGLALIKSGDPAQAKQRFSKVLEIAPSSVYAEQAREELARLERK